jgi:K+ transporter
MKTTRNLDEEGKIKKEVEVQSENEVRSENITGITHSVIWGLVVIIVVYIIYLMIKCGSC